MDQYINNPIKANFRHKISSCCKQFARRTNVMNTRRHLYPPQVTTRHMETGMLESRAQCNDTPEQLPKGD